MRILLVQTSFIGDVVLSTPVIQAIRRVHSRAEVSVLTTPRAAPLLADFPGVKEVLTFDKRGSDRGLRGLFQKAAEIRAKGFDRAYALQRSYRTALLLRFSKIPHTIGFREAALSRLYTERRPRIRAHHDVLRNLSIMGSELKVVDDVSHLKLVPPRENEVSEELRNYVSAHAKKYIVLVPGSAWHTKRWPAASYGTLGVALQKAGCEVVLAGGPEEKNLEREALGVATVAGATLKSFVGKLSLREMLFLIAKAKLVVCNDSAALHMGSAFKVPTVVVYCATSPRFGFGPWENRAEVVERWDLECKPCSRHGAQRCPLNTGVCMSGVSVKEVLDAVTSLTGIVGD